MKNYLPSKTFTYLIIAGAILALILFLIFKFFFGGQKISVLNKQNKQDLKLSELVTYDLLKQDSDGDDITDWEEALWGTDKNKKATFDGVSDGEYVKRKKEELKITSETNTNGTPDEDGNNWSETDKFAREFFATFIALQQSGQVGPDIINSLSASLGQKIIDPNLPDEYNRASLKLGAGGKNNNKKYYSAVQNLFNNYQDTRIGEEIDIVAGVAGSETAAEEQKTEAMAELNDIADSYQDFAKKLMGLAVPEELADYHLKIANSANNTGRSVRNMAKTIDDPIVGLAGLAQYQQYSEEFISSAEDLKTYLSDNGIII